MKLTDKLKQKAGDIGKGIQVVYYVYKHPGTGFLPKILIAVTLGYLLSPVDLIPDFIPVLGMLDDLVIIPAMLTLSYKLIPAKVLEECRQKAEANPVTLKDNWLFASVIILIWLFLILTAVRAALKWTVIK